MFPKNSPHLRNQLDWRAGVKDTQSRSSVVVDLQVKMALHICQSSLLVNIDFRWVLPKEINLVLLLVEFFFFFSCFSTGFFAYFKVTDCTSVLWCARCAEYVQIVRSLLNTVSRCSYELSASTLIWNVEKNVFATFTRVRSSENT